MSDEEDEGYKGPLHPRLTMDDITEVSGPEEIERKNTFQITKNTEARSKTVFSVIVGRIGGLGSLPHIRSVARIHVQLVLRTVGRNTGSVLCSRHH